MFEIDIDEKETKLVVDRYRELKQERSKYISRWRDIQNYVAIVYKKGRRDVWLILRSLLPKDVLAQIEIYDSENVNK